MAGITSNGFVKKTLAEIKAEREQSYRNAFGKSINLTAPSIMATLIGIESDREAKIWDLAEEGWNSRARSTAQGASLDNVGELTATPRLEATKSVIEDQIFFGDPGTSLPTTLQLSVAGNPVAKFKLANPVLLDVGVNCVQHLAFSDVPDDGEWTVVMPDGQTTPTIVFDDDAVTVQGSINTLPGWEDVTVAGDYAAGFTITFAGTAGKRPWAAVVANSLLLESASPVTIVVTTTTPGVAQGTGKMIAVETGPTVASSGALNVIDTPVTGLNSTLNISDATQGRKVEPDSDYRIRQEDDLESAGSTTVEAIRVKLKQVPNVTEAIVFQNVTMAVDGNGLAPKSVKAFVEGGDDQAIANQLWLAIGGGIESNGDVVKTVVDSQGLNQTLKFSRPIAKNVYLDITRTVDADLYPSDGDDRLKANAIAFGSFLKIGEDVLVYPKLLPALVAGINGILDISLTIGFAASPTLDDNLTIAANERAIFDTSRINVA
jgi:uncharacterized phage protein gp47/JayE